MYFLQEGSVNGAVALPYNNTDMIDSYQTLDSPAYQDFRAEAEHHRQLRQECFSKAQDAYRRGMKPVASFYAQQVIKNSSQNLYKCNLGENISF